MSFDTGWSSGEVLNLCQQALPLQDGFEVYPFKLEWYNDCVATPFKFAGFNSDTLAVLVLNTPHMFERAFKPWLLHKYSEISRDQMQSKVMDPLDQFMKSRISVVKEHLLDHGLTDVQAIHDFELLPNRRPKILMQTCGHVSGAAYYYRPTEENRFGGNHMGKPKKFLGLSLHPSYGGWFSYRAVLIFHDVQVPELPHQTPVQLLKTPEDVHRALEMFNYNWQDFGYRDVVPVRARYSSEQQEYFGTMPANRWNLIVRWMSC